VARCYTPADQKASWLEPRGTQKSDRHDGCKPGRVVQKHLPQRNYLARKPLIVYPVLLGALVLLIAWGLIGDRLHLRVDISKRTSFTDWALVALTGAYAIVSVVQWWKMRQSLEETRKSNHLTLRAWVMAEGIKIANLSLTPGVTAVRIRVRNNGKLPAIKWARRHEFLVRYPGESLLVDPLAYFEPVGWRTIAAGASHVTSLILPTDFTPEQLAEIKHGKAFLWLVMRFTYTDTIGSKGSSAYCWRYEHQTSGKLPRFEESPMPGYDVS